MSATSASPTNYPKNGIMESSVMWISTSNDDHSNTESFIRRRESWLDCYNLVLEPSSSLAGREFHADDDATNDESNSNYRVNNGSIDKTDIKNSKEGNFKLEIRKIKYDRACAEMQDGQYEKSLETFKSLLSDTTKEFGKQDSRVGIAYHNVAIASYRAGKIKDAANAIENAIKVLNQELGMGHPKVTDSLVEFGIINLAVEEHGSAIKVFGCALSGRKNETHDNTPEGITNQSVAIAKIHNNIGCVYFDSGNFKDAVKSFDIAILVFSEICGGKVWTSLSKCFCVGDFCLDTVYLLFATTICNKAYAEVKQKKYESAVNTFREAIKILKDNFGAKNKFVKNSLEKMGYCYIAAGEYEEALRIFVKTWKGQEMETQASSEDKLNMLRNVIFCEVKLHLYEQALVHLGWMEDLLLDKPLEGDDEHQLNEVRILMGHVNYETLKYPSLAEVFSHSFGLKISTGREKEEEARLTAWKPVEPELTCKISGHKIGNCL